MSIVMKYYWISNRCLRCDNGIMVCKTDTGMFRDKISWYLQLTINWLNNKLEKIDGASTCNYDETSKIFCISNGSATSTWWGKTFTTNVYLQKSIYTPKAYILKKNYVFISTLFLPILLIFKGYHTKCSLYFFHSTHCTPTSSDGFHFFLH